MPTIELLWTIREERRREASAAARERLSRTRSASVGSLVGWIRTRLRALRSPAGTRGGWTVEAS